MSVSKSSHVASWKNNSFKLEYFLNLGPIANTGMAANLAYLQNSYAGRKVHPTVAAQLHAFYRPSVLRLQVRASLCAPAPSMHTC